MYFTIRKKYTTLYETLDTLIEGLTAFTAWQFYLDRKTEKYKDQALKQHPYLGRKNNLGGHCFPNCFPRIGPNIPNYKFWRYLWQTFISYGHIFVPFYGHIVYLSGIEESSPWLGVLSVKVLKFKVSRLAYNGISLPGLQSINKPCS